MTTTRTRYALRDTSRTETKAAMQQDGVSSKNQPEKVRTIGYDMSIVNPSEESVARRTAAREKCNAAVEARQARAREVKPDDERPWLPMGADEEYDRLQREVEKAYDEETAADLTYFRLNITGMSAMRNDMERAGMGYWTDQVPEWPEPSDDVSEDIWDREDEDPDSLSDVDKAFLEEHEGVKSFSERDRPGIPLHKFCSNDGWLVTESDCQSAVGLWDEYVKANPEAAEKIRQSWVFQGGESSYFDQWLAFLNEASTHGGFRVW